MVVCRRDQEDAVVVHGPRYVARHELDNEFMLQTMEEIDVKQFVARHETLGSFVVVTTSIPELILAEVERLGFAHVHVARVGPYPVWSVTARLGASVYDCDHIIRVAVKRLAQNLGFNVKLRDILARVSGGCVQAIFCLDQRL
jgi:hypothetical protein